MSGVKIPVVETPKRALDPTTHALVAELRAFAAALEHGAKITDQKPAVRGIVDKVLQLSGYNAIIRALVVNSKYLK
jgi:hypothetical protein